MDIAIEFRVKNGRLKRAILAKWDSYAAFARKNHINYHTLNEFLGMRKPAYGRDDWRPAAVNIATALHMEPEEIWPDELRRATLSKNSGEFAVTIDEAASLSAPSINRAALATLTKNLRPNELRAITAMARGETIVEMGRGAGQFGGDVCGMRGAQIAQKAIRRMRHNARVNDLTLSDVVT